MNKGFTIAQPGLSTDVAPQAGKGFLYIGVGLKYVKEAEISAKSLRRFTKLPICLYTNLKGFSSPFFDIVIETDQVNETYGNKINGTLASPFYKTVFIDGDTFICSSIDRLFDVLDIFDMSMLPDPIVHSYSFWKKTNPDYKIPYEGIVPEYQTSVMVFRKNKAVINLLNDWLETHNTLKCVTDMISFREAYLRHVGKVAINPLPVEYDYNGTMTFGMLFHEVKIIHEKIAENWNDLRLVMADYEKMEKHAKVLNKYKNYKRLVLPYFGTIPYFWSPFNIKRKIKRMLGIRLKSKISAMPKQEVSYDTKPLSSTVNSLERPLNFVSEN